MDEMTLIGFLVATMMMLADWRAGRYNFGLVEAVCAAVLAATIFELGTFTSERGASPSHRTVLDVTWTVLLAVIIARILPGARRLRR